ncbi:MAG: tetratricopeptide repeat protein [Planctomycetota bacterium]
MSTPRLRPLLAGLGIFLGLVCSSSPAQTDAAADALAAAREAWSRGRSHEALGATLAAFDARHTELVEAEAEARELAAARATALLVEIQTLTDVTASWAETLEWLDGLEESPDTQLEARLDWLRLLACRAIARLDRAREVEEELAFVEKWAVIGPFDNERGTGFDTAYPPEESIDFDAEVSGKDRDVLWFPLATTPATGYIDFDDLMTPDDQGAAYAVTHVRVDEERRLALHIASDESFKVWVAGDEVLSRKLRRRASLDQDSVGIRLSQGWNRLLVKVCDQTGPWGFRLRLTELDGSRAEGLTFAIAPDEKPVDHASRLDTPPAPGAITFYRNWLIDHEDDGPAWADLSRLLTWIGPDDRRDHESRSAMERAVALLPERLDLRYWHAQTLRRDVEMSAEKEDNPMRQALEAIVVLDPAHVPALEALAEYYQAALGNHFRARDYLEQALAIQPDTLGANWAQWRRWRANGWVSLADRQLQSFASESPWRGHPRLEAELASVAVRQHRVPDAIEHLRRAVSKEAREADTRRELVSLHLRRGEIEAARALLEDRLRLYPFEIDTLRQIARLQDADGELSKAVSTLDRALELHPDHPDLLRERGLILLRTDAADEARESLDRSLTVKPNQPDVRRYLEHLRSERRPFELDHRTDVTAWIDAARAESIDVAGNEPAKTLLDETIVHVNRDGTRQLYRQVLIHVLNEEGIRRNQVQQIPFALGDEVVKVKRARVIHRDGSTDEARIRNAGPRGGGEYRVYRAQNLDLPNLGEGDLIHLEYRIDAIQQSFFGNYFGYQHRFPSDPTTATELSRLTLILPKERQFYFNQRHLDQPPTEGTIEATGERLLTWELTDLERQPTETLMPAARERLPMVEVTTFESWDAFSRWWWNLIESQFDVSSEMRAKVQELTAGLESRDEKIRAIYNFIVSDIRYVAWEFGVHGYQPYRASTIFARRFGDCKDKAILMNTMLGIAGIQAYPVVIRAEDPRSREDLSLAMVEHFNHCISYVPEGIDGEPTFLDGTAEWHSVDALPGSDRGAKTVVVQDERGEIVETGYLPPSANSQRETYDITLRASGSARVDGRVEAVGPRTYPIRKAYATLGDRDQQVEARYGTVFGPSRLIDAEFSPLENLNAPVFYTFSLDVERLGERASGGLRLRSDFFPENLTGLVTDENRETDLLLANPFEEITEIRYRLPVGWSARNLPESVDLETPYSFLRLTYEAEADTIVVRKEFGFTAPRVPLADYPEFREFCLSAYRALQNEIFVGETQ